MGRYRSRAHQIRVAAALAATAWLLTAASPPKLATGVMIRAEDYPTEARQRDQQGLARIAIRVATDGRPVGCDVIKSSGVGELDAASCRLFQSRARFDPARDDAGNAVEGVFRTQVPWTLGYGDVAALSRTPNYQGFEVAVRFDDAGEVAGCAVNPLPSGARLSSAQSQLCQSVGNRAMFSALLARTTTGLATASYRRYVYRWVPGASLPMEQPIYRELAKVTFDRLPDGGISWCEVTTAPAMALPAVPEGDLCAPGVFGANRPPSGGIASSLVADVIATPRRYGR